MDKLTRGQRSYNMSRIRAKNTKPELIIFKMLKVNGYRFRKHYKIPGKPDVAFPKIKKAIFIDGEFWHGEDFDRWKHKLSPFWLKKISSNIKRDRDNEQLLKEMGWDFLRLWGKEILHKPEKSLQKIVKFIG